MAGHPGSAMISSTSLGAFNVSQAGNLSPAAVPMRSVPGPVQVSTRPIAPPVARVTPPLQNRPRGSLLDISA
ncbi:hypothetical protein HN018_15085 [Lichenicola cladoniae]|uniref:Uncharacterized protein n=1 Tax=Lichenicola cladoniae TaxID=1484109 RepID=A0A6M8HRT0_9PROT|nr:hypothetical protein [Lichenicola cladoniae]NPD65796.1 hypothetical protein [Acetobacteraceae bacterium]QKE91193.1 hypothetical protein HN018_15085 [Lichenicola cladoniae]